MATKTLKNIEKRIDYLRRRLFGLGDFRPGTLTVQYRNPTEKKIPFHQISYTHKGKSRSEYVTANNVKIISDEINTYKKFKSIMSEMIELSIQASRIRCKTQNELHKAIKNN